jgi:hypothetical protein
LTTPAATQDDAPVAAKPASRSFRVFGPVALVGTLTADDVAGSAVCFNARYLLEAAAAAPIPATKQLGNLTRTFVERAFDDMRWPAEYARIVRTYNRRLDEPDVWRLHLLRVALQNARLLRKYRGAFSTTTRGLELLAPGREGKLYLELFAAYFERTNLAFTDGYPEDPWLQHGVPDVLALLHLAGANDVTIGDLAAELPFDVQTWTAAATYSTPHEKLSGALRRRILEPLEDFGLVTVSARPKRSQHPWRDDAARVVTPTPLFTRFVVDAQALN